MYKAEELKAFYRNKKVLLTGATGFKGSWLSMILNQWGAKVYGLSLEPSDEPALFKILKLDEQIRSEIIDIRDYPEVLQLVQKVQPDIVIHMAAQPLVRRSYEVPRYTYEVNVMGTVNILDAVRLCPSVRSFLNITTDKVYLNSEKDVAYKEEDPLDGYDPYSNSKSCSELVTHAYKKSFLDKVAVSTARAGNVIGGGDFAKDRVIPDCFRAMEKGKEVVIRHRHSVRPYQHVLEQLAVYLTIIKAQYENPAYQGYYNVCPDDRDIITTGELVEMFSQALSKPLRWVAQKDEGPYEAQLLKLDNSLIKKKFNYQPRLGVFEAIQYSAEWYEAYLEGRDMEAFTSKQINEFFEYV